MSPLEELQQLTERERTALIQGDWRGVQETVARKLELCEEVESLAPGVAVPKALLRRLREATTYNQALASRLSRQVSELLGLSRPEATYTRAGRLPSRAEPALLWRG